MFKKLLITVMDKLIMDTQILKEELSTASLKRSSHTNGEKGWKERIVLDMQRASRK